ncbi:MAG: ribosomal protein S18-alanine N-acetyltransferase [Thiomicrospira sp.]|uniref:ribosomal protein S18-alanine N-acetyltransferase n=1 Tax=Thiomicrospira sp. TaxID=935 RepID=UPI0019E51274|nr:ribosomal protein S18-alanine N-acetyltransferase [Thiomicrospira sp.]MBE0492911.1 ribosomal protein S18-alanine N-acetyltransferase [Thiomicrospira sp.]
MFSHLKPLDESDLDWVMQIEHQNYTHPWTRGGFERALHQGLNYLLMDASDAALGYCCLLPVLDELHLLNLSIAANCQNQGVAKLALQAIFSRFENTEYTVVLLEVRRSNKIARNLYKTMGFVQDGVRKNYYQCDIDGREDAILMSKRLDS